MTNLKKYRTIILYLITYSASMLFAQQNSTVIQGKITSRDTGFPLPGVNVVIVGTKLGAAADSSGFYNIKNIPAGKYTVKATHIGYKPGFINDVTLSAGEKRTFNFSLLLEAVKLKAVKIEAERQWENYITDVSMVGVQRMKSKQIVSIPGAFDDPARAVQIFSGVADAGDFNAFLAVRGGSPDQNLVVMDGVVIPNPYRFRLAMGGGLSIFDPNITQDVHLHLGGFSAEYGNRLSSVLEVETRNGSRDRFALRGSVNLTDAGGSIEGPIPGKKGSWLISARRTYFDLIAEQLIETNSVFPYSYDLNGKVIFDINPHNRISVRSMKSEEGTKLLAEISETINLTESSTTDLISLTWRSLISENKQIMTIISYYDDTMNYHSYNTDTTRDNPDYEKMNSQVNNWSLKENFRWQVAEKSWLTTGIYWCEQKSNINFNSLQRNFYYARNEFPGTIEYEQKERYMAGFIESTSKITNNLQMRIGLRYNYSTLIEDGEICPRFNLWYKLDERTKLEGSWGVCYQYPDPVSIFTRDQPLDFSTNLNIIQAEKATHHVIGIKRNFYSNLEMKLEFYYKDINRLLLPSDKETYNAFNSGNGLSKGFEFMLHKKSSEDSRITGIISYSYSSSKYREITAANWIPFKYDRRHGFTTWCNVKLLKNLHVSFLWRLASGLPYTPIPGVRISQSSSQDYSWDFIRGSRNSKYFPVYQRLDMRLSYKYFFGEKYISVYLDFINLYNYKNIYDMTWEKQEINESGETATVARKRTIYMLPLLPSLGISFRL